MSQPLTISECKAYYDELSADQWDMLAFVADGRSGGAILHPHITDFRTLRRWLQDGVNENNAMDEAESRADRRHASLDA
jgi:hypothetical protein